VKGNEVRDVRFSSGGYDAFQVDDLLRRIAVELDAGRLVGPLIAEATFSPVVVTLQRAGMKLREVAPPGYDTEAVDWFLDQPRRDDHSELPRMDADPWRELPVGNHFTRGESRGLAQRTAAPSRPTRLRQARLETVGNGTGSWSGR